ncbi:IS4-like element ISGvi3 family transposase [Gloeobacter violaceus]|uniref:Gll1093 protein n=1 Tax=Gloeobacter violaceus (strain ATCC 29082 / PCC 7421) TaxID=251221 RepID=Q7M787_GLOVI|nr:IS4-like element ISGvi3 family transposase [Gloeobacter violaceus]BAC88813.1 glr0872 [Gloeobacter violaceus PCC 7421]BAC89034.1 gll1093 [Gloeobacter violaceus PCC 7421]BAC90067.1 gll2126 [Gloeobacter violaceus PCC 7421]
MLLDFPQLVKTALSSLPNDDFPVLDSRLFFSCWLALVMDKSTVSMRDLFKRVNHTGIPVDISTFSKACKSRSLQIFEQLYQALLVRVRRELPAKKLHPCPIDSTVVGLTSKLLWAQDYHQVKLLTCLEHGSGATEGSLINFGYDHDSNFVNDMLEAIPENGVGIFDRGFAGLEYLKNAQASSKYFLMRIPSNYKLTFEGNAGQMRVGTGKESGVYRVVNFCDIENRAEYRLVTNLPAEGEWLVRDEEVMELYRQRWQIELLWKFLKMHLKLKRLMTKNENGIRMQLYITLIAHLLLELVSVPKIWGSQRLDKLRYLQCCMCQEISYVHWLGKLLGSQRRRARLPRACTYVH